MNIIKSFFGFLLGESEVERRTIDRSERRHELATKRQEKREEQQHKREETEREAKEREQKRQDRKEELAQASRERRDREDRARAERAYQRMMRKKNPKGEASGLGWLDAGDKKCLETAQRMSQQFHGTPDQVVELSREERILPRFAVVIGAQRKIAYEAPAESQRAGVVWEHESGDRGAGKSSSRKAPLLLADPESGIVFTVRDKSPMKFSSSKGIVG